MNLSRHLASFAKRANRCLLLLMPLMLAGDIPQATERVQRRFDSTTGLTVPTIFSLAQDAEGFIWLGTAGGVVRYDGNQMRPWAKDIINRDVFTLATSLSGETLVAEKNGKLYRVTPAGVELLPGPGGKYFDETLNATFESSGRLWVVTAGGHVHVRDGTNNWRRFDTATAFPGRNVQRVSPAAGNRVYFLTGRSVWEARGEEKPRQILNIQTPLRIVEHPDGSVFVLAWPKDRESEVIELRDGRAISRVKIPGRACDMALRGGVVWASFDRYLVSIRANEPPDVIGPEYEVPGSGPLLVDHEGSLWLGTYSGLIQYPEPETTRWNERDGLPSSHMRSLVKTEEGIWAFSWQGLGRLYREGNVWRARNEKLFSSLPCMDAHGTLILGTEQGMVERRAGRFVSRSPWLIGAEMESCTTARDGTLLLATRRGIFRDRPGQDGQLLSSPPGKDGRTPGVRRLFEDQAGRLWAATGEGSICRASALEVLSGQPASWLCQTLPNSPDVYDFIQLPSGSLWMSTNRAAVWRYAKDQWEQIPGSRTLASQMVFSLAASPSGGVWIMGHGTFMRVVERLDSAEGWEVAEVVSLWEGLTAGTESADLFEEPDGELWCVNSAGVIRIPVEARRAEAGPPPVKLVDVVINGRTDNADTSELPYGSQVELHFAALSYRDRGRLRYQYRLRSDSGWIDSRDTAPVLRFVDLGSGDYQAEVRASLDGQNWSIVPARFAFKILKPWYLRTWAVLLFTLVVGAILYAVYRARISVLMRLERQRTQIARDLHDEMGSGLGSIGILSGLAAQNNLDGIDQQELAKKISDTAGELGTTLTEIVWALRPGTGTLEALAYRLAERGGRLFPVSEANFRTQFPASWPKVELSLAVRRNVLLIVSEALHNAARHSQAKEVTLGLEPAGGKSWKLWLNDDGCGLSSDNSSNGSGMGLQNMRRRAEEIGAAFSLLSTDGKGTSLSLVFDPNADDRRLE
jgi:hypothetical protein